MTVTVEMDRCPFDGAEAYIDVDDEEFDIARACCRTCGGCGPFVDLADFPTVEAAKVEAARRWNQRHD